MDGLVFGVLAPCTDIVIHSTDHHDYCQLQIHKSTRFSVSKIQKYKIRQFNLSKNRNLQKKELFVIAKNLFCSQLYCREKIHSEDLGEMCTHAHPFS